MTRMLENHITKYNVMIFPNLILNQNLFVHLQLLLMKPLKLQKSDEKIENIEASVPLSIRYTLNL